MLSPLRNRFGIPGVISVIALVFAMLGGAYAANNDGGSATASAKAKKGPRGPKGPKGDTGPAGPQGPAGSQGPAGANGKDGTNGTNGSDGTSVANSVEPVGVNCTEGGSKFVGTATTYACNGKKGTNGKSVTSEELDPGNENCPNGGSEFEATSVTYACNGEPWTAGGVLPKGATETGTWSYGPLPGIKEDVEGKLLSGSSELVTLSFPIPLKEDPGAGNVHFLEEEAEPTAECPGSASEPEAKEGHVCVYAILNEGSLGLSFTTQAGAILFFGGVLGKQGLGTFAVTGF